METRIQSVDNHIARFAQEYILKRWDVSEDYIKRAYITYDDLEFIINYVYDKTPYKRSRIKRAIKRKFKIHRN